METKFTNDDTKVVKFIAIVLMITHHCFAFDHRLADGVNYIAFLKINGLYVINVIGGAGKLCVGIFLMLSGFATWQSYINKYGNHKGWDWLYNKVKRVYFLYWITVLIFLPLYIIKNKQFPSFPLIVNNFLGLDFSFYPEAWFLRPFVILTISFPVLIIIFKNSSSFGVDCLKVLGLEFICRILLSVLWEVPYFAGIVNLFEGEWIREILLFASCYFMGIILAKHDIYTKCKRYVKNMNGIVRIICGCLITAFTIYWQAFYPEMYMFFTGPLITLGSILMFYRDGRLKSVIVYLGSKTTGIWLTHTYFCYYYFQKLCYAWKFDVLILLTVFSLSLFTSILVEEIMRLLEKAYKRMIIKI